MHVVGLNDGKLMVGDRPAIWDDLIGEIFVKHGVFFMVLEVGDDHCLLNMSTGVARRYYDTKKLVEDGYYPTEYTQMELS
jgi:hypothetical protein